MISRFLSSEPDYDALEADRARQREAGRYASRLTGGAPRRAPAADGDAVAVEDQRAIGNTVFGVKYFCRSTSTILAGSDGCSFDDAPFGGALLRVLKTQKTTRRERPLGDVHGVR